MINAYKFYTFLLLCIFTLFGALKPIDLLPDMMTYKEYFESVKLDSIILVEFSYVFLSRLVLLFSDSFRWVILFYVFTALYIKFLCFRLFEYKYLILLMYLCSLLILHEFIQIRIALALSFLLLGVVLSYNNKLKSIICFFLALFFHTSAILFVLFFYSAKLVERNRGLAICFFIGFFSISIFFLDFLNLLSFSFSNYIFDKVMIYVNASSHMNEGVNMFSFRIVVLYIILLLFSLKLYKITRFDFIIYFCVISLLIFAIGLRSLPDLSFRFIDMAIFFSIFMIANLRRYYSVFCFYLMSSVFIISSVYYNYRLLGYIFY